MFTMSYGVTIKYRDVTDENNISKFHYRRYRLDAYLNGKEMGVSIQTDIPMRKFGGDIGNLEVLLEPYAISLFNSVQHSLPKW